MNKNRTKKNCMVSLGCCHQKILVGDGCNIKGAKVDSGINAYDISRITSSKPFYVNQLLVCGKNTQALEQLPLIAYIYACEADVSLHMCIISASTSVERMLNGREGIFSSWIFLALTRLYTCLRFRDKSQLDCAFITLPRIFSTSARACVGGFASAAVFNSFSVLDLLLLNALLPLEFP